MSLQTASIAQHAKALRLAAVGAQFVSLAEEAAQRNHSHLHYLEALLQAEVEDRERRSIELRMQEAHLPRIKTLEEFDFTQSPHIPAARIRALAEGGYLERAEPVLLVGDPGTGKSHLATGLAIAACRQRRRVRFTTAAALVNQLVEAQREHSLSRMLARWSRVELIVIDELGYVPLAEVAAELLFQVIAERAEKAAVIVTTNLPFSEWPQVFTNTALQGYARSAHRPGAHHRDGFGVVPLPENPAEEDEGLSLGIRFCFRSALRATLQQNRAPSTSTSQRVGQNKPPKWAKPSCQTQARASNGFSVPTRRR
jgi:DNA replication protein DnaC